MKRYKLKSAKVLLVVFSAILLTSFYYSTGTAQFEVTDDEVTVIHKHEFSGEAPGNISRVYVDQASLDGRIFQDFSFQTIQGFHSQLSHTSFLRVNLKSEQFKAPVKVYKKIRKFLI